MSLKEWCRPVSAGLLCFVVAGYAHAAKSGERNEPDVVRATSQSPVTPFVIDVDVRDLPESPAWQPGDPVWEVPKRAYPQTGPPVPIIEEGRDPLVDRQISFSQSLRAGGASFTVPIVNVIGIPYNGAGVPDTVGDVGENHIIEMINGTFVQIWDKAVPTPNALANFVLDSLGTGACANGIGGQRTALRKNCVTMPMKQSLMRRFIVGGTSGV